jgi:putative tricarboxylic transport membrane protein
MVEQVIALLSLHSLMLSILGIALGVVVGALPGLNGGMLMSLTLPLTFFMKPVDAQVLLIGMYVGDVSGGMIASTLIGVAGAPSSIMTTLDAYPMARAGHASKALGIAVGSQFLGSALSWFVLAFTAAPLARFGLRFGNFEVFALVVAGLVLISAVGGKSFVHALIAGAIGILCSLVGLDPVDGQPRLTFGVDNVLTGFDVVPVLLGVFGVAPILYDRMYPPQEEGGGATYTASIGGILRSTVIVLRYPVDVLRATGIGTAIGVLPGIGTAIGATISYSMAKLASRNSRNFGTGIPEGIIASEAGNHATVCGSLVPMIGLGIPGSPADVILMAALILHAIQPGPLLVVEHPDIFYSVIGTAFVSMFLMLPITVIASVSLSNVLRIPENLLAALVIAFCFLGAYVSSQNIGDIWILIGFSVFGLLMLLNDFPLPAFVIGFILGPMAEKALRSGLMESHGSLLPLAERPIPLFMMTVSVALVVWVIARTRRAPG